MPNNRGAKLYLFGFLAASRTVSPVTSEHFRRDCRGASLDHRATLRIGWRSLDNASCYLWWRWFKSNRLFLFV